LFSLLLGALNNSIRKQGGATTVYQMMTKNLIGTWDGITDDVIAGNWVMSDEERQDLDAQPSVHAIRDLDSQQSQLLIVVQDVMWPKRSSHIVKPAAPDLTTTHLVFSGD
jgi:hypothetical protein